MPKKDYFSFVREKKYGQKNSIKKGFHSAAPQYPSYETRITMVYRAPILSRVALPFALTTDVSFGAVSGPYNILDLFNLAIKQHS